MLDFLAGFQDDLEAINGKLGALQGAVAALHKSVEAKLGRPVLEVLNEYVAREQHASMARLEAAVYIPPQGLVADDRGAFEESAANPAFDMLDQDMERAPFSMVSLLKRFEQQEVNQHEEGAEAAISTSEESAGEESAGEEDEMAA